MNPSTQPTDSELRSLLSAAQRIFVAGATGFPRTVMALVGQHPDLLADKEVVCAVVPGFDHQLPEVGSGRLEVFFATPGTAAPAFVPMQYRRIWDRISADRFDLALVRLVGDGNGGLRYGLGVDFQPAAIAAAKGIVAEVAVGDHFVADAPVVPLDKLVATVPSEFSATITASPNVRGPESAVAERIGALIAELIRDGDCLQIGIGLIPEFVLRALSGHRDLGCHSGMIGEGMIELHRAGVLTGLRKSVDRGKIVTGFIYGDQSVGRWAAQCDDVALRPVNYTHDARVLASIDRLVSINSAIEVDLAGQVNAEMVAGRQVSGTGGSVDFVRGAALSSGGRSIVALPATAKGGSLSRIVATLAAGTSATLLRTDVDYVVTEHGVAHLSGRDAKSRAESLISVAAPEFQNELAREALRLSGREQRG